MTATNTTVTPYRHRAAPPGLGWMQREFVRVEQGIVGSITEVLDPYAILTGEVGVVRQWYPRGDVRRYGAYGDASIDDTEAFANARDSAIACGFSVYVPPGYRFRITATLTCPKGLFWYSDASPAGGIANLSSQSSAIILHDFDGSLFVFDGADGALTGGGGGLENLRLVNVYGSVTTPDGRGAAIKLTGSSASNRTSWTYINNVLVENSFSDSWSYALDVDGLSATGGIPDLRVVGLNAHIPATNGAGIRMQYGSGQFMNCAFYQTGGNIILSGASGKPTSACNFVGCNVAGTVALDWATGVTWVGGKMSTLTDTANTGTACSFSSMELANPFTSVSGNVAVWSSRGTQWETNVPMQIAGASAIHAGVGAPGAGVGSDGDYYFRQDTPGTALQRIYVKDAGAWNGIV